MGKKVYAIKEGFDFENNKKIEDLIVDTWADCLKYVKGVKGAKYKSFESMVEAKGFLADTKKLLKKGEDSYPLDIPHAYVDGSFNISTGKFGYGLVVVRDNIIEYIENGAPVDDSKKALRQIAGELKASVRAAEYAVKKGYNEIVIFHDYEGISHHATGYWERRDKSSEEYYDTMNSLMANYNLKIIFVKVDSHTGDLYNEIADEEAKAAIEMELPKITLKWLKENIIEVINEEIKEKLLNITSQSVEENIIVANSKIKKVSVTNDENIENTILKLLKAYKEKDVNLHKYISELNDSLKNEVILEMIKKI
ncbi:viroplasmin family protein [Clostridium peptidivorans]|uniref:ribonuclease H1 domain-containing protein n=1 Tax=Clostridium peptidivorans TaxID=100174 RepID=UPI000BE35E57|nr:ribonuclease H family protein [Clostridium peptidivorans]